MGNVISQEAAVRVTPENVVRPFNPDPDVIATPYISNSGLSLLVDLLLGEERPG